MSEKTNNVSTLPDVNRRILELVSERANGNVSEFSRIIEQEQQKVDRLFKVDKRTQKFPKPSDSILESIIKKLDISKGWLLLGVSEGNQSEDRDAKSFKFLSIEEKLNLLYQQNLELKEENENIKDILDEMSLTMEISLAPILRHFKLKVDDKQSAQKNSSIS
ncbi:hypothetical protein DRF62_02355 [Chryseobacterium piscium]|uniref:Uncharacterized protein n=1 Tax=Chryseobacterium piscium TaxID=333702 RepID=A0A3D9BU21_9FLAO|nr:hypothetical protein [Chryseobacterium piscium]REC57020.1 hypothetical protein DRF62_02355 [Chryseobacterium piscium]